MNRKPARSALRGAISKLTADALDLREVAEEAAEQAWMEDQRNARAAIDTGELKTYVDRLYAHRYAQTVELDEDSEYAAEQFAEVFVDRILDLYHGLA